MARRKKKEEKEEIIDTQDESKDKAKTFEIKAEAEVLLRPKEWAVSEGLNPVLFEVWKNGEPITKEQFEKLKEQVM